MSDSIVITVIPYMTLKMGNDKIRGTVKAFTPEYLIRITGN